MPSVSFFNADVKIQLLDKLLLKQFIPSIFLEEGKPLQAIKFIFCSDEYLLSLNKQFLNHDYYTDILTFDLSTNKKIIGEIYISTERVFENSALNQVSFQDELNRVIFHGILHLCSYSDTTENGKADMTIKENEYLIKYASFHVKQD